MVGGGWPNEGKPKPGWYAAKAACAGKAELAPPAGMNGKGKGPTGVAEEETLAFLC